MNDSEPSGDKAAVPVVEDAASAVPGLLGRLPGAGLVSEASHRALDTVSAVSPAARRAAVYAGAGALGLLGVIDWPIATAVAAVAWLTQQRPERVEPAPRTTAASPQAARTAGERAGLSGGRGARRTAATSTSSRGTTSTRGATTSSGGTSSSRAGTSTSSRGSRQTRGR